MKGDGNGMETFQDEFLKEILADGEFSDKEFLEFLDLSYPGLEEVKLRYERNDMPGAIKAYLAYRRSLGHVIKWYFDWSNRPKGTGGIHSYAEDVVNRKLEGRQLTEPVNWEYNPWSPSDPSYSKEWTNTLNRFYFWESFSKIYWDTENERYAQDWIKQFLSWIDQSIPINSSQSKWGPYETGIRLSDTWPNAYLRFLSSPSLTPDAHSEFVKSTVIQAIRCKKWLEHNPDVHGNFTPRISRGLLTAGILFPEFSESKRWIQEGLGRLELEILKQVYPDGAQKELTVGYHILTIEDFRAAMLLATKNNYEVSEIYSERLRKMYEYLLYIGEPDITVPQVNDSGNTPLSDQFMDAAELFGINGYMYAFTSGRAGVKPEFDSYKFEYAGYYVMRSGWDKDARYLLFDGGPLGISHHHEDKLNIILWAYGKNLIADGGTHYYDNSKWRQYVLTSQAHNVVIVDGQGQRRRIVEESCV
jgi:hypothetical protein